MIDSLSGFLNTILVRSKKKSTITPKAYANMKRGFPPTTMSSQPSSLTTL